MNDMTPGAASAIPAGAPATRPESFYTRIKQRLSASLPVSLVLLALVLAGLPLAVWLDLHEMSEVSLRGQAAALSSVVGTIRAYYAENVVGRVTGHDTVAAANYQDIAGAIPIPATLSLDIGDKLGRM